MRQLLLFGSVVRKAKSFVVSFTLRTEVHWGVRSSVAGLLRDDIPVRISCFNKKSLGFEPRSYDECELQIWGFRAACFWVLPCEITQHIGTLAGNPPVKPFEEADEGECQERANGSQKKCIHNGQIGARRISK
jgi:hypothetical protein